MDRPKFGIGTEALEKLEEMAEKLDPDVIIYDEILKPSQSDYNLASHLWTATYSTEGGTHTRNI